MIMKSLACQILIILALNSTCAQSYPLQKPDWNVTIKVIDEAGLAVSGANVEMSYYVQAPPGRKEAGEKIRGFTDEIGIFRTSHTNTGSIGLGFQAIKTGYYPTIKGHEFAKFKDNDPTKWNPTITLVLKRVREPIPMYAKLTINLRFPILGKSLGYDLTSGDWDAPYGRGENADIFFKREYSEKAANDYYSKITVSFPNKGDGIQVLNVPDNEEGSALRSTHQAPVDGYESRLTRETSAHPGQASKFEFDEDRVYLFRVRTVLDEQGSVKSALYGKIYGEFMQFRYYLNATPNDRNIEFDPKQNLLKGLNPLEQVSAP